MRDQGDSMDVYWLEQTESDVPQENDWLSTTEAGFMDGLRFAQRRSAWRLGRWTAKRALAIYLNWSDSPPALANIEIRPATSGAPMVFFDNTPAAASISLSHRNGTAICAVAPGAIELGCDLELIEPRSDAFIADYFTAEEQALVVGQPVADRPRFLALLWSAKESALKALRTGLRLDTRCVVVDPMNVSFDHHGWKPLDVRYAGGRVFHGWWMDADNLVRTVVSAPPPGPPIPLKITARIPEEPVCHPDPGLLVRSGRNWKAHDLGHAIYAIPKQPIRF
jgi:4'-phosphopantetheinyl transferase